MTRPLISSPFRFRRPRICKHSSWQSAIAVLTCPSPSSSSYNSSSSCVSSRLGCRFFRLKAHVVDPRHSLRYDSQHSKVVRHGPCCGRIHPVWPRLHLLKRDQSLGRQWYRRCRPVQSSRFSSAYRVCGRKLSNSQDGAHVCLHLPAQNRCILIRRNRSRHPHYRVDEGTSSLPTRVDSGDDWCHGAVCGRRSTSLRRLRKQDPGEMSCERVAILRRG